MSVLYTGEGGSPSMRSSRSFSSPGSSMPDPAPLWANAYGRKIILPPEMRSVLWGFYQLATGVALLAAGPFLLARRGGHYLPTLAGRLGLAEDAEASPAPVAAGAPRLHR